MSKRFMPHTDRHALARLLRQIINATGKSPRAFAWRCKCSYETINHILRGEVVPSYQTLEDIAYAAGLEQPQRRTLLAVAGYWPWPELSVDEIHDLMSAEVVYPDSEAEEYDAADD